MSQVELTQEQLEAIAQAEAILEAAGLAIIGTRPNDR